MIRILLLCAFLIAANFNWPVLAQGVEQEEQLTRVRKDILKNLESNTSFLSMSPQEKETIAEAFGFPMKLLLEHGGMADFQYIDESGLPVYYKTTNVNAAITTGARSLQPSGNLNVNLTGKGRVVGIYDQTRPKFDHLEFEGRVIQRDGSSENFSVHATHVSGTILAAGKNANARGMANESTGWTYNWDADVSKMTQDSYDPVSNPGGTLISNHSYGLVLGWYRNSTGNWAWAGNSSIDPDEDYRFGFYSAKSQALDNLAFAKPYYSIVWAAGNDRSDVGNGSRDADGPEDTIGPDGVAKNVFTIGAVRSVTDYKGPNSVEMSNFSSWGPTDDGRIKPDLVSMGVNVFSTSFSGETDQYTSLSGTSMAAPNATGSMFLLQQLYHERNSGRYMRSATLKALSIHTARETGQAPGPDYIFGWGLLNVEAAANIVINEDGIGRTIKELVLKNNESYEFDFLSDGMVPIRATIAWTDPAGSPPPPSLNPTNLMLVNDLDLRIFDEDGKEFFPWTLDPSQGSSARARNNADNFRDNVEQVFIAQPEPKKYTIRVTHKNSLTNGAQEFALVITAGTTSGSDKTLYWIGGDGEWHNQGNWSLTANGNPANLVPDKKTRVVFDANGSATNQEIQVSDNAQAFSLNYFGNHSVVMDLGGNVLDVGNGVRMSNQALSLKNGEVNFSNDLGIEGILDFGTSTFHNLDITIAKGNWKLISGKNFNKVTVEDSQVSIDIENLSAQNVDLKGASHIEGSLKRLLISNSFTAQQEVKVKNQLEFIYQGVSGTLSDESNATIRKLIIDGGELNVAQIGQLQDLQLKSGKVILQQAETKVQKLDFKSSSTLVLAGTNSLEVVQGLTVAEGQGQSFIESDVRGKLIHDLHLKYCFESLNVSNVDLIGLAVVNLGPNANIVDSNNWSGVACNEVLFADFDLNYLCENAMTSFVNRSQGDIAEYLWTFGEFGSSIEEHPNFAFPEVGAVMVSLEISNNDNTTRFEKEVVIGENSIGRVEIVANGNRLTSMQNALAFQWYLNGNKIEGAIGRTYTADDDGMYQVAIFDESCNRISAPVVISAIEKEREIAAKLGIWVGANPTPDYVNVSISNDFQGKLEFELVTMNGQTLMQSSSFKNSFEFNTVVHINAQPGVYILRIKLGDIIINKRIIKI